ncbi:hypothetical protein ABFT80_26905 [Mesorhizobium sp. SB112]|uniref:hypothetical protein n=1 Tax=Mesorhizobium sp. SB112 TaxID=3151853 RepID=UPI0032649177
MAKSLITRDASADDGRAQTLVLTEPGIDLVPELAALADRTMRNSLNVSRGK